MSAMKILADLQFSSLIGESNGQTATGSEFLNNYKSYLTLNESSCALVNRFIREAQSYRYDNGVNKVLETVADYINLNKTSWALASACESINANNQSYNYLNRNAAHQVEKLLEMNEEDVVSYIKAGALKNVMFCESFRNIAKQVFKDNPVIESTAEYTVAHPVSMTENVGDGICFEVAGTVYKIADDKSIQEASWKDVSNTFRTISQILESDCCVCHDGGLDFNTGVGVYHVSKEGVCVKSKTCPDGSCSDKEMTAEQLREDNRFVTMALNGRERMRWAGVLEGIALVVENFDKIVNMDNVSIYETKRDRFAVIESGENLYSTLLASSVRAPKWTVNESAMKTVAFIKDRTNVSLSDVYTNNIKESIDKADEKEKEAIQESMNKETIGSYKDRIAALTEKFKGDPVKLAVLSSLASDLADQEL